MTKNQQWISAYGPWAVITGASDGVGKESARLLAQMGLNLVLIARRQHILDRLALELSQIYGTEVRVLALDLAEPGAVEKVIAQTDDVDVGLLIAAAGFGGAGTFIDMPIEREVNMLDVNTRVVLQMCHHYGKLFAKQGRGGLILFSSLLAFQGAPLQANYAATKAYIQSLAEGLHHELAPHGVDVLVSAPGPIETGFAARANMQMGQALQPKTVAQATLNALGKKLTVRPGFLSKFLIGSLSLLPRPARVRVMHRIMAGMTQHE